MEKKGENKSKESLSARRVWIEIISPWVNCVIPLSLSARRVWIEIEEMASTGEYFGSLSARRVWIEILSSQRPGLISLRHSPRGGCGLKSYSELGRCWCYSHSPRGGCGLKSIKTEGLSYREKSLSARRVWIEMSTIESVNKGTYVTLREEGVD